MDGSGNSWAGAGQGGYALSYRYDVGGGGGMSITHGTSLELSMQCFSSGGVVGVGMGR